MKTIQFITILGALTLPSCMAAPLLMGVSSMGALGGQIALTNRLGRNAGTRAVRKQMTALAIGGSIDPDAVRISHLTRNESTENWIADTPSGRYSCSVGRGRTDVSCVRA